MADQQPAQNPAPAQNAAPVFNIQRVYLKEASLEQPNSPAILLEQEQPTVEITLHVATEPLTQPAGGSVHEVTVSATVQTKVKDKTLFLAECKQAGIFEIRNVPDAQLTLVLNVACPQIVYPYLRGNLADLIIRGGFPPVHLAEINFQAMYEQQQAQQQAQAAAPGTNNG